MVRFDPGECLEHPEEWMDGVLPRQTSSVSLNNVLVVQPLEILSLIRASTHMSSWQGRLFQTFTSVHTQREGRPFPRGQCCPGPARESGSSSASSCGSVSAPAQRAQSPGVYSRMHDRNGFIRKSQKQGHHVVSIKEDKMDGKERKQHKWPKIVKG